MLVRGLQRGFTPCRTIGFHPMAKCALRENYNSRQYLEFQFMYAYASCGFLGIRVTMKVESLEQKIAKQEERLKQLKAQKQAVLAREKAKQKEQDRKDDTRRKILIGSCMLKITEDDEQARAKLIAQMDKYLMDERDRKLFNL